MQQQPQMMSASNRSQPDSVHDASTCWRDGTCHRIGTAWEKTPVDETQAQANAVLMAAAKELANSTRALLTLTNPFLTHSERESHRIRRDAERLLERIGIEL